MKRFLELEAIKEVLVEMVANDKIPMDMTQLDIHEVDRLAMLKLAESDLYSRTCRVEKLKSFVSYDTEEEVVKSLVTLEKLDDQGEGDDLASHHISVYQPFENSLTVGDLLEAIS